MLRSDHPRNQVLRYSSDRREGGYFSVEILKLIRELQYGDINSKPKLETAELRVNLLKRNVKYSSDCKGLPLIVWQI